MNETPSGPLSHLPSSSASAVEFPCSSCGKLLRVGPGVAGRQARCPECSAVVQVPETLPGGPPPAETLPPTGVDSYGQAAPMSPPAPPPPPGSLGPDVAVGQPPTLSQDPPPAAAPPTPSPPVVTSPASAAATGASGPLASTPSAGSGVETSTKKLFDRITAEIQKIYIGQHELVLGTLVALFSSGHVLIESVPGLGKTLFVRTLGRILGCQFGRIQFTADLMPSDITGAPIFDMKTQEFRFWPGPVFTQILLCDEINRSPAKTHAALLEIMQEHRVTIDGKSHRIERPFLVMATQNPIESEGTYNLPEAQLDRFMFKLVADYPAETEEASILKMHSRQIDVNKWLEEDIQTLTSPEEILRITLDNGNIRVDQKLIDYINKIVRLTRQWPQFHMGASPRAGLALVQGARTLAACRGRNYAVPDDVVELALPVLRHRVILTAEAEVEGHQVDELLTALLRSVEVPRM